MQNFSKKIPPKTTAIILPFRGENMSGEKLIKLSKWIENTFEKNSRPSTNTIKKLISNGDIRGEKIGTNFYVYENAFEKNNSEKVKNILSEVDQLSASFFAANLGE